MFNALCVKFISLLRRIKNNNKNVRLGKNLNFSIETELVFAKGAKVNIGNNEFSDGRIRIIASQNATLMIGNDCYFNMNCFIGTNNYISIGNHCVFGPGVVIVDNNHQFKKDKGISNCGYNNGEVHIGNNCWIGANAVILKDTYIGDGCIIGAGCVVQGNVPSNSILTQHQDIHIHQIEDR